MRKGKDLTSTSSRVSPSTESSRREGCYQGQFDGSFIDQVRQRAYELYEERVNNNFAGDPTSDWLTAEEQVRLEATRTNGFSS